MPELPEVEVTCQGIKPHILGQRVQQVVVRQSQLRWPIPSQLSHLLLGQEVLALSRRGKYIILHFATGGVLIHLGMSGTLRVLLAPQPPQKHDHVDLVFANQSILRLHDPRRFGCLLWQAGDPYQHALLRYLGPEPLSDVFDGQYLFQESRSRRCTIKQFIMNSDVVVGVGNIYANESLFYAGIHPKRAAGRIARVRFEQLAGQIKRILTAAIQRGGTTLKDFVDSQGVPGYFKQELAVYGKVGEMCIQCQTPLSTIRLQQRTTVYCPRCQR